MPTVRVCSAHNLASDFSTTTRPFCTVHLGKRLLGKTSILFDPSDDKGELFRWLKDDETATFNFTKGDIDTMFESSSEEEDESDLEESDSDSVANSVASPTSSVSTTSTTSTSPSSTDSHSTSDSSKRQHRDIIINCYHSESVHKKKTKYLGCVIIPLDDVLKLPPGKPLDQIYELKPNRKNKRAHIQGQLTISTQASTMSEALSKLLLDESEINASNTLAILQQSKERRTKNAKTSEKIDHALEDHWNNLEGMAAERVDRQLESEGKAPISKPKKKEMSYIQKVMTGAIFQAPLPDPGLTNTKKKKSKFEAKRGTPADRKIAREIQTGSDLQLLNMGIEERAAAEAIAKHKSSKVRADARR